MFLELIKLANKKRWKVFLLGGSASKAKEVLERSFGGVKIEANDGPMFNKEGKPKQKEDKKEEIEIVKRINEFKPQLLFIGFGAPKQEKWLARWLPTLKVGGGMVVGGAFDYIAGKSPVPPRFLADTGLEWLWRLITQPWRIKRIFNAVIIFPLRVFLSKFE